MADSFVLPKPQNPRMAIHILRAGILLDSICSKQQVHNTRENREADDAKQFEKYFKMQRVTK